MSTESDRHYEAAASLIRVHGIISIIFGGIGLLFSLIIGLAFILTVDSTDGNQLLGGFILSLLTFLFAVLPHAYLLVSGIHLLKNPKPSVAKTLIIINLVVGALWNYIVLIFAIINLTQLADYRHGYPKTKE